MDKLIRSYFVKYTFLLFRLVLSDSSNSDKPICARARVHHRTGYNREDRQNLQDLAIIPVRENESGRLLHRSGYQGYSPLSSAALETRLIPSILAAMRICALYFSFILITAPNELSIILRNRWFISSSVQKRCWTF